MLNKIYISALVVLLLCSCSGTKYVSDGEYLLDKVSLKLQGHHDEINADGLKSRIRQKGNSRWFATAKIPLATYSVSGRDTTKWINRVLRSMGEPPVIYDSAATARTVLDLKSELANEGYMHATVSAAVEKRKKKANVTYWLSPGEPYYIDNVKYVVEDSVISRLLCLDDSANWGLKPRMRFSVDRLDNERKRITSLLADRGFYKFHKDYITYVADTVSGCNGVDITLVLRAYRDADGRTLPHPRYRIRDVRFSGGESGDSLLRLRRHVLYNNTFLTPGEYYSARELQKTYNHFGRLQAVKYTNISFREMADSLLLDCDIQVSTNKPSTISFQPEGTNTAGNLGAAASLTYQNRTLFRGSVLLSIELRGAFDAISGLEGYNNDNFEEYSVETSLLFPRFIAPFLSRNFVRRTTATSEVAFLYDLQNRPEYHRRVLSLAWRYKWNNPSHHDKYQIDLIDLNYVFMPWISDRFRQDYLEDESSRNAILRYNYEDLFIMRFGVGYTYNNGVHAIKANVETAGNVLGLGAGLFGFPKNDQGQYKLFNIAYAQYVKGDFDYTRYVQFDYNNTLVWHFGFGIAYPYGNSTILPFEKRYFSGGANSVRGWSVRGLGPGTYSGRDGNIDFINQTGDMKIDVNLEYRAHLFWKLNGALFVDAGNIWTLRNYADQPGGQFSFKDFWEQIAVAYGVGLRLNFDYFILRFDFGMKAVNPACSGKDHYPVIHPDLGRDLTFHFAVGLPF